MKPSRSICTLILGLMLTTGAVARDALDAIDSWNSALSDADRQAKYCKMATSAFLFYRGTNHLFWQDIAGDERLEPFSSAQSAIWLQGDLHTDNYGRFEDPHGVVVYNLNDFDEGVIADYQYDLWRMVVSLILVARENGDLDEAPQLEVVEAFGRGYLDRLQEVDGNDDELTAQFTAENSKGRLDEFLRKGGKRDSRKEMLEKWAPKEGDKRHFDLDGDKLGALSGMQREALESAVPAYLETLAKRGEFRDGHFKLKDAATRLNTGTGSLGTTRYYLLIEGPTAGLDDDIILDVKHQGRPTPYAFLGSDFQQRFDSRFSNQGERHALAMQALTRPTDPHLGWLTLADGDYSVRQRSPGKDPFPTDKLNSKKRFLKLARQWGELLALAHARADNDFPPGLIDYSFEREVTRLTRGREEAFLAQLRSIASEYADQVNDDWQAFYAVYQEACVAACAKKSERCKAG